MFATGWSRRKCISSGVVMWALLLDSVMEWGVRGFFILGMREIDSGGRVYLVVVSVCIRPRAWSNFRSNYQDQQRRNIVSVGRDVLGSFAELSFRWNRVSSLVESQWWVVVVVY